MNTSCEFYFGICCRAGPCDPCCCPGRGSDALGTAEWGSVGFLGSGLAAFSARGCLFILAFECRANLQGSSPTCGSKAHSGQTWGSGDVRPDLRTEAREGASPSPPGVSEGDRKPMFREPKGNVLKVLGEMRAH